MLLLTLFVAIYIYYQSEILEDQSRIYTTMLVNAGYSNFNKDNKAEIYIKSYDSEECILKTCILNECDNTINLPCPKLNINEYDKTGRYEIRLDFSKNTLFPFSKKEKLISWSLFSLSEEENLTEKNKIVKGIKDVLKDHYIWEASSVVMSNSMDQDPTEWIYNSSFGVSHEYLKAIYLLEQLAVHLDDEELNTFVKKEIEYLNNEGKWFVNKRYPDAFAYILELVDSGLDAESLEIYKQFQNLDRKEVKLEPNYSGDDITSNEEDEYNESDYNDMIMYADNYKIFDNHGYDELARFYRIVTAEVYKSSNFGLIGLCHFANLGFEEIESEKLTDRIVAEYTKEDSIVFNNLHESIQCLKYLQEGNSSQVETIQKIENLITNSTITLDDSSYVFNAKRIYRDQEDPDFLILRYNLLNNIEYVK